MAVWRLQTNTDGGSIAQYCLDNSVAAMGWSLRELSNTERESISSFSDFCNLAEKQYNKFDSVLRIGTELQAGDLIWMRTEGKYYIGRVTETSKWCFCNSKEAQKLDASNQISGVHWYPATECADEDSVPGAVATAFIRGSTFQRIQKEGVEAYSQILFNQIHDYEEDPFRYETDQLELNEKNFYSLLQPDDAEDLLCLWLFKSKGYICIPSTNKKSTPKYECVLIDPKIGKHVYIQVKKGQIDLNAEDYCDLNGEVYLLTTQGNIINQDKASNVFSVSPTEIFNFAIKDENRTLIPESIQKWVEFLSSYKGIMFDTNLSFSETDEELMLQSNLVCAYGGAKRYIRSFSKGDYVLFYSKGKGIIAIGRITSEHEKELQNDGLAHAVEIIVPTREFSTHRPLPYISVHEIKQLLNRNFYWASTIKTPFLKMEQVQILINQLNQKYENF